MRLREAARAQEKSSSRKSATASFASASNGDSSFELARAASSREATSAEETLYALYDFSPRTEDEMELITGDPVTVITRKGPDGLVAEDWWLGRNVRTFAEGLFPPAYVGSEMPSTTPQIGAL